MRTQESKGPLIWVPCRDDKGVIVMTLKNNMRGLDWTPLLVIDRAHAHRYGTIKLLERLFNEFEALFPYLSRDRQFVERLYLERLIIELVCQYVEDVGSYSVACLETGLLYAERVVSVTSREIWSFYKKVDKLTDDDLRNIFGFHLDGDRTDLLPFLQVKDKYKRIREFHETYQSLYNAIKHGSRVISYEIPKTDVAMNSMHGTYVTLQWVDVNQRKSQKVRVRTWNTSETEIEIRDRKLNTILLPSDDISEFVDIAEDCYQIIKQILMNHAPKEISD